MGGFQTSVSIAAGSVTPTQLAVGTLPSRQEWAFWGSPAAGAYGPPIPRVMLDANQAAMTSGVMTCVGVYIPAGVTISRLACISGTTAASGSTHLWLALYDTTLTLAGQTADDTAASPLASNTWYDKPLGTPYVTTVEGVHYVGIQNTATTVFSTRGFSPASLFVAGITGITGITAKASGGTNGAALTTTAPTGPIVITTTTFIPNVLAH